MPYQFIEDFKYGMDRRRPRYAGVPGTLWDAENVVLSRGGDIERAKAFVATYTLPSNTFGLAELNGRVYVFGSADLAGSMPPGVEYQRLVAPSSPAMTRVLSVEKFDGKLYVVAEYADGNRYHFYDGSRVTDWDTVADALASAALTYVVLAELVTGSGVVSAEPTSTGIILTARTAGTGFSATAAIVDGGGTADETVTVATEQSNVAAVAAVEATADLTITGGSFDPNVNTLASLKAGATAGTAIELLGGPVSFVSSNSATATAVAVAINERTDEHGYSAAAVGATVTVTAIEGSGTAANSYSIYPGVTGDVTTSGSAAFSGGQNAVTAQAQIDRIDFGGTFQSQDTITVTVDGTEYKLTGRAAATGDRVYVSDSRVFSTAGPALYYCILNDPTDWTTTTTPSIHSGRIVVSTDSNGAQRLTGVETYQGYAAIFADDAVVIYQLDENATAVSRVQEIPNTGTLAGSALKSYGANDLFYLDSTGIRSLQQRDSSQAAFVSDAGTSFDPYVQTLLAASTLDEIRRAQAVIEPRTGAYWLTIGDEILVLTNYQGTGIRGWTRLTPGFTPTGFARLSTKLLVRDATTVYTYGGASGTTYPGANEMVARVKLPFLTARDDAGFKHLTGFDFGAENEWLVTALVDPNNESATIPVGRFSGVTYAKDNAEQIGETTHVAYEFTCSKAGYASISNMALHHVKGLRA